jgi:hypothetical protein
MGGLGNQIFQIFATLSYAIKTKRQFKFLNLETLGGYSTTIRHTFWKTFFSNLNPFLISEFKHEHIIKEKDFTYSPLPLYEALNKNVLLFGYFQSYKYFEEHFNIIKKIINFDIMKEIIIKKMCLDNDILNNNISMHFRIGDYKKLENYHPITSYNYYERALNHIKLCNPTQKFNILFFCEDDDIDDVTNKINTLKQKFVDYSFIRSDNNLADWEQMILMSCCHHNIIANSSFSWWSAYFNSWKDKIICYPSVWFGPAANHNTKDLCPIDWIKIQV